MADPLRHLIQVVPGDIFAHTVCGATGSLIAEASIEDATCPACLRAEYELRKQATLAIIARMDALGMVLGMRKPQPKVKGGVVDAVG